MIYSKKRLDFSRKVNYNTQAEHLNIVCTRRSRVVRPSAHDWKSCNTHKVFEGSNPSFSAIITSPVNRRGLFFARNRGSRRFINAEMLMGNDNFQIRVLLSILVEGLLWKKYTDKELAAMSQEELKTLQGKAPAENKLLGQRIEKILTNVSHQTAVDGK